MLRTSLEQRRHYDQRSHELPDSQSHITTEIQGVEESPFHVRNEILSTYSKRELTKRSDKLPDLTGLARLIQKQTGNEYVAGLWRSDMVKGMLWMTTDPKKTILEYRAPCWSWASTDAPLVLHPDSGFLGSVEWSDTATIVAYNVTLKA